MASPAFVDMMRKLDVIDVINFIDHDDDDDSHDDVEALMMWRPCRYRERRAAAEHG